MVMSIGILGCSILTNAQTGVSPNTFFDLLVEHDSVELTLVIDPYLLQEKDNRDSIFTAQLTARSGGSSLYTSKVKVSPRGRFRLKECDFPPLALDFPKSILGAWQLATSDNYKLVTHCNDPRDTNQTVCKEYLAYKLYSILTSKSFRTKWLTIHYIDEMSHPMLSADAFLIESNEELRHRLGGNWVDSDRVAVDSVDAYQFELAALFQYMIGNRDMHLTSQHNVRLLRFDGERKFLPIPYDFDFSLFVMAPYAYPGLVNRNNVRRVYLGYARNEWVMPRVFSKFRAERNELIGLIEKELKLSERERKDLVNYIDGFYDDLLKAEYQMNYRLE